MLQFIKKCTTDDGDVIVQIIAQPLRGNYLYKGSDVFVSGNSLKLQSFTYPAFSRRYNTVYLQGSDVAWDNYVFVIPADTYMMFKLAVEEYNHSVFGTPITDLKCAHCGEEIDRTRYSVRDGEVYCGDCGHICEECGEVVSADDVILRRGHTYCRDCVVECEECGELIMSGEDITTYNGDTLCEDCAVRCDDCDEMFCHTEVHIVAGDSRVCNRCVESYCECSDCGYLYHEEGMNYCDSCETSFCRRCYDRHNCDSEDGVIASYSYRPVPAFRGKGGLYMGVEVEVDNVDNRSGLAGDILEKVPSNHLYIKEDGSLTSGIEIVSHPWTLGYHKAFKWKVLFGMCLDSGARSHDTKRGETIGTCGLHIHVDRAYFGKSYNSRELAEIKILYVVDKFWKALVKFSRRVNFSYCHKISYGTNVTLRKTLNKDMLTQGRYFAINLHNTSTIEFRLWRGTLNYKTFMATMEFTEAICSVVKHSTVIELQKITWKMFIQKCLSAGKYNYLEDYLNSKSLIGG